MDQILWQRLPWVGRELLMTPSLPFAGIDHRYGCARNRCQWRRDV